jgi:fibronectin-binding autotransporter adhesin
MGYAKLRFAAIGAILLALAAAADAATTYYWYGSDAGAGGAGTWNASSLYWRTDGITSTDSGTVAYTSSSSTPNSPYFAGTDGIVTVSGTMYVSTLTIDTANYYFTSTYSGGRITYQGTTGLTTTYTGTATMNCRQDMASSASSDTSTWNIGTGGTLYWGSSGTIGGGAKITLKKTGGGMLTFDTDKVIYQGILAIDAGTVSVGIGNTTGILSATRNTSVYGATVADCTVASGAYLVFNRSNTYTVTGNISTGQLYVIAGEGNVVQAGSGMTVFTGDNTYTGPTTISNGTLSIGGGGATGSIVSNVLDNGVLAFNRSNAYTYANNISGAGSIVKWGAGVLTLTGTCGCDGGATLNEGGLTVNGSLASAVNVIGGVLGGSGTISGAVTASAGTVSPGSSPATLTIAGVLALGSGASLSFELNGADTTVGGGVNDLIQSVTNLTLDGTLNVTATVADSFLSAKAGDTWTLITYSGLLTDNGLDLGTMPTLSSAGLHYAIDTTAAGKVNLVVVPEPGTMALLASGLLGLIAYAWRKRK